MGINADITKRQIYSLVECRISGSILRKRKPRPNFGLFMQDEVQQGTVNFDAAFATFVLNQPQFPELVHKEADAGSGCANHLSQHFESTLFHKTEPGWGSTLGERLFSWLGVPPHRLPPRLQMFPMMAPPILPDRVGQSRSHTDRLHAIGAPIGSSHPGC